MEMQGLSDEDLVAVVSYLKTVTPVRRDIGPPAAWVKHQAAASGGS